MTVALLVALAPAVAIICYIYAKDEYDKEPFWLLVKSFSLGIVSIIPALIGSHLGVSFLDVGISEDWISTLLFAFVVVALSEELAKFIFLRWVMFPKKDFDEPFDGIVYAVMIGMGFATFENILYVWESGLQIAILRMFTAVPAHAAFGVIMGFYVGQAKFVNSKLQKERLLGSGLFWAIMAHGLYDFFLMQQNWPALSFLAFIVLIAAIILSQNAIKIHQEQSPFNPNNQTQPNNEKLVAQQLHSNVQAKNQAGDEGIIEENTANTNSQITQNSAEAPPPLPPTNTHTPPPLPPTNEDSPPPLPQYKPDQE